jgi:hypothetical protein
MGCVMVSSLAHSVAESGGFLAALSGFVSPDLVVTGHYLGRRDDLRLGQQCRICVRDSIHILTPFIVVRDTVVRNTVAHTGRPIDPILSTADRSNFDVNG